MSVGKCLSSLKRNPGAYTGQYSGAEAHYATMRTLIFSISSLNLLVHVFLDISLQNSCSRRFIKTGGL
jgi:hypothetical protein